MAALAPLTAIQPPPGPGAPLASPHLSVLCLGLRSEQMQHHTMVMSSPRLAAASRMPTEDLCGCAKLYQAHCLLCHQTLQDHLRQAAQSVAVQLKVSMSTVFMLLRDLVVLMVNRLPASPLTSTCSPRTVQCPSPLEPVHRLLHQLATDPTVVSEVLPTTHKSTTDTSPTSRSSSTPPVTVAMAQRGLGSAGSVPIPYELWSKCTPSNLHRAAANAPQQPFSQDPMLHLLAQKLTESGLLQHAPPGLAPNAKAYLSPNQCRSVH